MSKDVNEILGVNGSKDPVEQKASTIKQTDTSLFFEKDETSQATIGRSYFQSLLDYGSFSKSNLVLSNKRIYQVGKMFGQSAGGRFYSWKGSTVIPLRSVTGTGYITQRSPLLIFFGWLFLLAGIIGLIVAERDPIFGASGLILSGVFLLIGYLSSKEYFFISYEGGPLCINTKWYSKTELEEFQKTIQLAADKECERIYE